MSIHHGSYVHAEDAGHYDPKCPNCTIERLERECDMRRKDHLAACGRIDERDATIKADRATIRRLRRELREARRTLNDMLNASAYPHRFTEEQILEIAHRAELLSRPKPARRKR